jgi:Domain of unknown function (DUF4338)
MNPRPRPSNRADLRAQVLLARSIKRVRELRKNGELPITLRGRRFTQHGLTVIAKCVAFHYADGRTKISEVVCRRLRWNQPNGWPKDRACREVLRKLDGIRVLTLPPARTHPNNSSSSKDRSTAKDLVTDTDRVILVMPEKIEFELAKGAPTEALWNALIEKYHYLGHRVQVGRCLKYLIWGDGTLVGAICYSSPAWKLGSRDKLLSRIGLGVSSARDIVINNSRFCILPRVRFHTLPPEFSRPRREK